MNRNIIEIDPKKFPWLDLNRYTFTLGVEKNGILYISRNTASAYDKEKGRIICKGDIVEQTKLAFEKMGVVLEAAGMSFANVVRTVEHIDPTALHQYPQVSEIRSKYLGSSPASNSAFCVQRLLRPDALIEISAVAMRDQKYSVYPDVGKHQQFESIPAVQAGETVWFSGLIGNESIEGKTTYPRDVARQMELAYQNVDDILKFVGGKPSDVVSSVDFISPRAFSEYRNTAKIRESFFNGEYPASTGIVMNRLLHPEAYVDLDVVAVLGEGREEIKIPEWDKRFDKLTYRPGVKKGRFLYIAGMVGVDHITGQTIGKDDVLAQADKAYENIAKVLASGGYSMDDIVNTVEWVAPNGITGYRQIANVRRKYFGERFTTATGVQVFDLLRPEWLIEVTAVAIV